MNLKSLLFIVLFHFSFVKAFSQHNMEEGSNPVDRFVSKVMKRPYEKARAFSKNRAAVCINNKWGFINRAGIEIIPTIYDFVYAFSCKSTMVRLGNKYILIDTSGKTINQFDIDYFGGFKNDSAQIIKDKKYTYINSDGKLISKKWLPLKLISNRGTFPSNANTNCPDNLDFDFGDFTNWYLQTGTVDTLNGVNTTHLTPNNPPTAPIFNHQEMLASSSSPGYDLYGGSDIPLTSVDGSPYFIKLGNDNEESNSSCPSPCPDARAESIEYTLQVPNNPSDFNITYDYAVVLVEPDDNSHDITQRPRFTLTILDVNTNEVLLCGSADYVADSSSLATNGGFRLSSLSPQTGSDGRVWYKPWTTVFVNLNKYSGRNLKLVFTTRDCTKRGHWGYAYIDVRGCKLALTAYNTCSSPTKTVLDGPVGFYNYNWYDNHFNLLTNEHQAHVVLNNPLSIGDTVRLEVTPYTGNQCMDTLTTIVSIQTLNYNIDPVKNICSGANTYIGGTYLNNCTFSWSPTANLSSPNSSSTFVNPTANTTYTLTVTDTSTSCFTTASVNVNIKPKPVISVNNAIFCDGDSAILIATGADSYLWSPANLVTIISPNSVRVFASNTNNYVVTGTGSNGCTSSDTSNVLIQPKPIVDFPQPAPKCLSNNIFYFTSLSSISTGSISSYLWNFGDGNTASDIFQSHSYSSAGNYDVTLIVTSDNGCKDSVTKTIKVNPKPFAYFVQLPDKCVNNSKYTFTSNSSISSGTITDYVWDFGDNTNDIGQSVIHTYSDTGTYTVKLTVVSDGGCVDSAKRVVHILSKPTASFDQPIPQCLNGNNFSFNSTSITSNGTIINYLWDFGNSQNSNSQQANNITYSNADTFNIKLIIYTSVGCSDTISHPLIINPEPIASFPSQLPQCLNANLFHFTNSSSISTGSITNAHWYFGDNSDQIGNVVNHHYDSSGSYDVKLVVTSDKGCKDEITKPLLVYTNPSGNVSPNNSGPFCSGDSIVLSVGNPQSGSGTITGYQWSVGGVNITGATNSSLVVYTAGNYQVQITNSNGCSDKTNIDSLKILSLPTGNLDLPDTTFVCENGSRLLTGHGGGSYQWYLNGNLISGATNSNYLATSPGVYTLQIVSQNGCKAFASGTVNLRFRAKPIVSFDFPLFCKGVNISFNNTSIVNNSGTTTWLWDFGDSRQSTLMNPTHTYDSIKNYVIQLTAIPSDCPDLITTTQTLIPVTSSIPGIRYTDVNALMNSNTQLNARPIGVDYLWTPSTGLISSTQIQNPIFNFNDSVKYIIRIGNPSGCLTYDTLLVRVFDNSDINVPTGFSPNEDGHNDYLDIFLVGVDLTHFWVFNRWGQLLFETTDPRQRWDGKFKGKKQPSETYVWQAEGIDTKGNKVIRRGQTILIR